MFNKSTKRSGSSKHYRSINTKTDVSPTGVGYKVELKGGITNEGIF